MVARGLGDRTRRPATPPAYAAAVVSHAGYGSMLGALAHGVPLVATPLFAADQWHNARRVAEAGAGVAVTDARRAMFDLPGADAFGALPNAVRRVLGGPGYRGAARAIAAAIRALPPVDASVDVLAAVARDGSLIG